MMNPLKRSQRQEKAIAKQYGGRRQPASGGLWFAKGDVKSEKVLFEAKSVDGKSYTLKFETLQKIENEALIAGRMAAMQIRFERERRDFVVISDEDFGMLLDSWKQQMIIGKAAKEGL